MTSYLDDPKVKAAKDSFLDLIWNDEGDCGNYNAMCDNELRLDSLNALLKAVADSVRGDARGSGPAEGEVLGYAATDDREALLSLGRGWELMTERKHTIPMTREKADEMARANRGRVVELRYVSPTISTPPQEHQA